MIGYKAKLRDNIPHTLNLALLWCKTKERWINHVYDNFIKIYVLKEDRKRSTAYLINNLEFDSTLDWDNMSESECDYWKYVSNWVKWFYKNIENLYPSNKNIHDYISFLTDEEQTLFLKFIKKYNV